MLGVELIYGQSYGMPTLRYSSSKEDVPYMYVDLKIYNGIRLSKKELLEVAIKALEDELSNVKNEQP